MRSFARPRISVPVAAGERVLAATTAADDTRLAGTRRALYIAAPGAAQPTRIRWQDIEAADWDRDTETFRLSLVGSWGERREEFEFAVAEPRRLLELVRERVTASVVLQRHVGLAGRRGVRVIGRRAPDGTGPVSWFYEYDEGIDPADPTVVAAATEALAAARADIGEG